MQGILRDFENWSARASGFWWS